MTMATTPALTPLATKSITQSIDADAELANAARALANRCIEIADYHLTNGSPQMQVNIIKAIMPAIGRGMRHTEESDEIAAMREDLLALQQQVLGPRSA